MYRRSLLCLLAAAGGCGRPASPESAPTRGGSGATPDGSVTLPSDAAYGYTHLHPSGNRYVEGCGGVSTTDPVDVPLPVTPSWVAGAAAGEGTVWAVVGADGSVHAYRLVGREVTEIAPTTVGNGGPPLLAVGEDEVQVLTVGAAHSSPVPVDDGLASVGSDGHLHLPDRTVPVGALPDARVVFAGGSLYLLADPTDDYAHGVLGDTTEARSVVVVDPSTPSFRRITPERGVIEGTAPVVAGLTDAPGPDIVVTVSDDRSGASIVAFRPDGTVAARSDPVGRGFRWRHQIAVAPFGPGGEREVASVLTPHIGGVAQFHRATDMTLAAERRGYSSHRLGSRNLDMAAAADFDGDGRVELLVPTESHDSLAALRRTRDGVAERWRVAVGGALRTNLAATAVDGRLVLAAGRDGALRLWPSSGRC